MKNIPENCLTCKFMDFVDDELEELGCFYPLNMPNSIDALKVEYDHICDYYEVNKAVIEDAKQGCW